MTGLYEKLGTCHPSLTRGMVWCDKCGRSQQVNSAECFRSGWPECCGYTMSLDSPEERARFRHEADEQAAVLSRGDRFDVDSQHD